MSNQIETMGRDFVKRLFDIIEFNIAEYTEPAVDEALAYCLQEFKKACDDVDIEWDERWEDILYD